MSAMHIIEKMGMKVGEIDKLTGTLIGRAKSATFRTMDVVGLDTMVNVSNNLYVELTEDGLETKPDKVIIRNQKYGMVTACVGGGQGVAGIYEFLN